MPDETRVRIESESDCLTARQKGRALAGSLGFSGSDQTLIATAISEIARNIVQYAKRGEIVMSVVEKDGKPGILIVARDEGPGIPNIELAMQDGYSTGKGLGLGLPGARRLMDEFEITSKVGKGTKITMKKWMK
jgi:serine/threonine-protein kinase RsbT